MSAVIVRRGDNVIRIAKTLRENSLRGASLEQVIVAIYQKNPTAFTGNMLRLKHTRTIEAPTEADALALPKSEAAKLVRDHRLRWEGEQRTQDISPPTPVGSVRESVHDAAKEVACPPHRSAEARRRAAALAIEALSEPEKERGVLAGLVTTGWLVDKLAVAGVAAVVGLRRRTIDGSGNSGFLFSIRDGEDAPLTELLPGLGLGRAVEIDGLLSPPGEGAADEVFVAYGRHAGAESALWSALGVTPGRHDLCGTLLDFYAATKNLPGFLKVVGHVLDHMDERYAAAWHKIARIGRDLDPGSPVFSEEKSRQIGALYMSPAPATVAVGDDAQDLDTSQSDGAVIDLNISPDFHAPDSDVAEAMIELTASEVGQLANADVEQEPLAAAIEPDLAPNMRESQDSAEAETKFELAQIYREMGELDLALDLYSELETDGGLYCQQSRAAMEAMQPNV